MYLLSDILFFIAYHLAGYRRKVVRENLAACFPEKSKQELREIERQYYRHMCDLLIEGAYNLFASPDAIKRRYRLTNRQLVDRYYEQGRTVVLMSAHYGNWEYMVSSLNMQMLHHAVSARTACARRGSVGDGGNRRHPAGYRGSRQRYCQRAHGDHREITVSA